MGNQHGNQQVSSAFLDLFAEVARQGDPGQIRLAPDKCEQHALHSSRCPGGHAQPSSLPCTSCTVCLLRPPLATDPDGDPHAAVVLLHQPDGVLPAAVTSMCHKVSAHAQALHNPRRAIVPLRNAIHRLSGTGEGLITPIHADLVQW